MLSRTTSPPSTPPLGVRNVNASEQKKSSRLLTSASFSLTSSTTAAASAKTTSSPPSATTTKSTTTPTSASKTTTVLPSQETTSSSSSTLTSGGEIDNEIPHLEDYLHWETVKTLKPKERKRQEVVNELFHTERTHARNLKILYYIFYEPLINNAIVPSETVNLIFSNLDELLDMH
uniref:DH domain-containing protein n=1 Tax=Romanomermis culicivorax TaxID=13658 RepID=A0A915ID51_ROMCU